MVLWRAHHARLYHRWAETIRIASRPASLLALLRRAIDRLGDALERECVGGLGAAGGDGLDHDIGALAHGVDQLGFLRRVLDPRAVVLRVHGETRGANGDTGFG